MKTLIVALSLLSSVAHADPIAITLHLECDSGPQCFEVKTPEGVAVKINKEPAMSFNPETVAEVTVPADQEATNQVSLNLTPRAASEFETLTRNNVNKVLALKLGDRVLMAPVIRQPIVGGRLMIGSGEGHQTSLLDDVPWLREKMAHGRAEVKRKIDRDMILYAIISGVAVIGTLLFAFRRPKSRAI